MALDKAGLVYTWGTNAEGELADAIFAFGEERFSRRIARSIVNARGEEPIVTTGRLAHEVDDAWKIRRAEDAVDLRQLAHDVGAVALCETAGDDQRAAAAGFNIAAG